VNPRTRFITDASELRSEWLAGAETIGVCGATSTPKWLMEQVAARAEELTCG
jgi:4-hydroxy-3-methylbut-2-enyl diphosphate reductase